MANQTVYPYGIGGSLPSSIGIINDLITGGADKALSAEQGKVIGQKLNRLLDVTFFENSSLADWKSGNISNGTIVTNYANRYLVLSGFPDDVSELTISRTSPDTTYSLNVYTSSDGTNYTSVYNFQTGSGTTTITLGSATNILFLLWDKPTDERAKQEVITVKYETQSLLNESDISNEIIGTDGKMAGIELVREIAKDLWKQTLTPNTDEFYWQQGGINGTTGVEESNTRAIRSNFIQVAKTGYTYINPNPITSQNFFVAVYNSDKAKTGGNISSFGDISDAIESRLSTDYGYIRLVYWGTFIDPNNTDALKSKIILALSRNINDDETEVKTYENPILRADNPDPTVWNGEDGYFYLYATGNLSNKRMYRSANLYQWESTGDAPFNDEEALKVATAFGASSISQGFWAPHMIKINPTTWNLYIGKPAGGVAILTSNNPIRNFKYQKFISQPSGAGEFIDAEVALDIDGKLWMFTGGSGSIYRRQMTDDGLDWADGSSFELCAGLVQNASGNTYREKTFEGPYLYRRNGYWYLFCSSGLFAAGNYKLRVIRSATLGGTFVDSQGNNATDGYAETVLESNGSVLTGPGHNAPIFVDSNNNTWILYHSHWSEFESSSTRGVCLDQVKWNQDGWPYIESGTPSLVHEIPSYFR